MTTISNQLSSIAGYNRDLLNTTKKAKDGSESGKQNPVKASGAPASNVQLTDKINELRSSLGTEAPVDAKKVEEIKTAIKEGRYAINYEALAEKMVEMEFGIDKK